MGKKQRTCMKNLQIRSEVIRLVRRFFFENNYLEVETPIRHPAPIPEAHIDPVESENWCLHASPEIFMKQLLAAGGERIFQIARVFRKGERGAKHLPELTMLEWYAKDASYTDLMNQLESLISFVAVQSGHGKSLLYQGGDIDLQTPWEKIGVREAFDRYASVSMETALSEKSFDEIMGLEIEPQLGKCNPVFLYDYPAEKASLAKLKAEDTSVAERFELYIAGLELCNGFTELTDPVEQKKRFQEERKVRKKLGKNTYPLPEQFLNALSDMPDAAGVAVGIDRLVMLFADTDEIDGVVAFIPEEM